MIQTVHKIVYTETIILKTNHIYDHMNVPK